MSMASLARVKFIKTLNMIRTFLGIIPKVPQTKFHQIRTTKSKRNCSCSNSRNKIEKTKKWEKKFPGYKTG